VMREVGKSLDIDLFVFGPETHMTAIVAMALGETFLRCCGSGIFIPDPGSNFFLSRVADPNFSHPRSRIRIKEFNYFNPKKWFLSWILTFYHPGSRIQG
jgi:hypothetical protein